LFYKKKDYETHLEHEHKAGRDTIRDHLQTQRIGRNCQTRFWCGFCGKIIDLTKKGVEGADERFNHIDDHFKQELDISTWVDVEGSTAKGLQPEMEPEESVADVLGSDGIGGGESSGEGDADDDDEASGLEGDTRRVSSVSTAAGRKRPLPSSDADPLSSSSSSTSHRPTKQQRVEPGPVKPRGAMYVICHQCTNGPWVLKLTVKCLMCQHLACGSCIYLDPKGRGIETTG
jgi:hypothetical protein